MAQRWSGSAGGKTADCTIASSSSTMRLSASPVRRSRQRAWRDRGSRRAIAPVSPIAAAARTTRAEHYLQWPDAVTIGVTSASMQAAFGSHNAYQRGIAFEAAGDRARAIWQLEHFLQAVDLPHPAIRPQVEDARARLVKLAGDARR